MGGFKLPRISAITFLTLLLTLFQNPTRVCAGPTVNVELSAAFPAAPFLLELLETAAYENASSYFPLLDRISDGHFATVSSEKELYDRFIQLLLDDGHLKDSESLSSYQLALSMRSSAPRIEAHYQYYYTAAEPSLKADQGLSCSNWVLFKGKQYCSPSLDEAQGLFSPGLKVDELQFDRILGNRSAPASILYTDLTSPNFGKFHKVLAKKARQGKFSYRIRHKKPSVESVSKPLIIPGWGAELALKKTDYIVIDDRNDGESQNVAPDAEKEVRFSDDELDDLKPLSTSEVSSLAVKASSFIMQSESPLDTLAKLSQDFPKYSSALAFHNTTQEFLNEHVYNRAQLIPDGRNIIWMNGVQLVERQIQILDLIDIMRKERKFINGLCNLGLTAPEAIRLLSHNELASVQTTEEVPRFDWRDQFEGGHVIIWLNNLEKDKRYADWPVALTAVSSRSRERKPEILTYLQILHRGYPGQLPLVRRDVFNLVIPVDLSDHEDVLLITETTLNFVDRRLPVRIGFVPITKKSYAVDQAKVVYHLIDTYGLQAVVAYLKLSSVSKKLNEPSQSIFENVIHGRKVKVEKSLKSIDEILKSDEIQGRILNSMKWIDRLAADDLIPPIFINGVVIPKDEAWLQKLSQQVNADLQTIQKAIVSSADLVKGKDFWVPSIFLEQASHRRNSLIIPEDQKNLKIFDVQSLVREHENFRVLPRVLADTSSTKSEWAFVVLIADLNTKSGKEFLATAAAFRQTEPSIELRILHNPKIEESIYGLSDHLFNVLKKKEFNSFENINDLIATISAVISGTTESIAREPKNYWSSYEPIIESLGLLPGQNAIFLNGRLIGPIPNMTNFNIDDMKMLLLFERKKRLNPTFAAISDLGLTTKIQDPLIAAKISSLVALSTLPERTSESIFEEPSTLRMGQFDIWKSSFTAIEVGNIDTASIQLTALLDPASPLAQPWVPILKVLSELEGVYLKLFLNPRDRLTELPIKRFYRYVLESKLSFDENGSIKSPSASFSGVPQKALLTVGLDIPPAWLVAPKISVHDLDNIKLSNIKTDIKATYELEHILIEGHSREVPGGQAPRGVQLVLGTQRNPHAGDTIIMSNLGYFQFKANPGYYSISLQNGRSSEIFNIDSVGAQGWIQVPGDEKTDVALMSFKGATLYPRLSRKPGMEFEDVLESHSNSKMSLVSQGLKFAQGFLSKGNKVPEKQASINVFSVASGHLYERMLNIMMVSVMKHTNHSVKFWFIEQFLSPSFKEFIPQLAEEYGFSYEMVTYKWPHWLRAQTEKQREIWGYKILFLDVLFPLSLNKVIFVDADQIVRTDLIGLVNLDLKGAPYGFTPMCDSRTEMEGFRFWKQGYWKKFLRGLPYHISALYVVDLGRFRQIAAGDRLRQQYHALSADPGSLSNLDQDLPNHMQNVLPIFSLPQEWLWCETWCSDEALKDAKTIDLCNNPLTKEPKLDRARRQVPEWTIYDDEINSLNRKRKGNDSGEKNPKSRSMEDSGTKTISKDEL